MSVDFTTEQPSQVPAPDVSYRTLLELATAIDRQTSVQAVLKSLHKLLSAILHFDGVAMMLLTEDRRSLRLVALERGSAGPHVDLGAEGPYAGTEAGRAIEEQRTIYVPDIRRRWHDFRRPLRRPAPPNYGARIWCRFPLPDEGLACCGLELGKRVNLERMTSRSWRPSPRIWQRLWRARWQAMLRTHIRASCLPNETAGGCCSKSIITSSRTLT